MDYITLAMAISMWDHFKMVDCMAMVPTHGPAAGKEGSMTVRI